MLSWLRRRRTRRAPPDEMWQAVTSSYPFLAEQPATTPSRLREMTAEFLSGKEFHGAQGLEITDLMAISIAAQAVLPVLHLGLDWYDDFVGIVVHPGEVLARREVFDDDGVVHHYNEVLSGEAMDAGPVMLSWPDVAQAGTTAHEGYNLVIHEFVHKIDMRDGQPDGCPPLPSARDRAEWLAVMQAEYDAFREKVIVAERFGGEPPWLDPYGAENISEFFAVACEAYFVNRPRFTSELAALLPLFDRFFQPKTA